MRDQPLLHHEDHPGAEPALLLIHGLNCDGSDWQAQVRHFAGTCRVLTLDLRGHGRSMHWTDGFDPPHCAADVVALLRARGISSAVVAGHSMGCRVAAECAAAAPDIVRGLLLVDGSRYPAGDPDERVAAVRASIEARGFEALTRDMFASMFLPGTDPALVTRIVERAVRRPPEVATAFMCGMAAWDASRFEDCFGRLRIPVRIVQSTHRDASGARSQLTPEMTVEWHEDLLRLGLAPDIERLYDAGHFTQMDRADAVNAALAALRAQVSAPA